MDDLTSTIIGCAMKVHSALGPGLLESAYEGCLSHELRKAGFDVQSQLVLPVLYDGIEIELGYRIDILVNRQVILELKCVEKFLPIHEAQLISYLRLSNIKIGLLINFKTTQLKDGIKRIVNNY